MDELNIDGKLYVSVRRAAKENKYHSDYLGQLIRGGKLQGRKVGRSWYVLNDSLLAYIADTGQPPRHEIQHNVRQAAPVYVRATHTAPVVPVAVVRHVNEVRHEETSPLLSYEGLKIDAGERIGGNIQHAHLGNLESKISFRKMTGNDSPTDVRAHSVPTESSNNTDYESSGRIGALSDFVKGVLLLVTPAVVFAATIVYTLHLGWPI